jgi:hypothetical protein
LNKLNGVDERIGVIPHNTTGRDKREEVSQRGVCNVFHYDSFGDNLQTCQVKSEPSQDHDWVVYRLGGILTTGKERGDIEIKDYVVLQKPQEQVDRLPPVRTLISDLHSFISCRILDLDVGIIPDITMTLTGSRNV